MTGLDPLADPLADLQPNPPRTAEKRARLISLADSILAARKRRVSLAKIAERLNVSPDYLSQIMAEHHGGAWTIDTGRRPHKAKGKKKTGTRTRNTNTVTANSTGEAAGKTTVDPKGPATSGSKDNETTAEPTVGPLLQPAPKSAWLTQEDMQKELERAN